MGESKVDKKLGNRGLGVWQKDSEWLFEDVDRCPVQIGIKKDLPTEIVESYILED